MAAGVLPALRRMFDDLGGIGRLVAGKTVAIKINMANPLRARTGHRPAWYTRWSHPAVIAAAVSLIGAAGARRIRILEGSCEDDNPLEENFLQGGWDPRDLLGAARRRRDGEHRFAGPGEEVRTAEGPGRRLDLPVVRLQPLVRRLRRDGLDRQAQGTPVRGRCAVAEQHDRDRAGHDLRRRGGVRGARPAAVRAPRHVPHGPPAAPLHRARRDGPRLARGRPATESRG